MREIFLLAALAATLLAQGARADDAERLRRAVEYTLSVQQPSGLFLYDFDFLAAAPSGDDNVVRQAGTLFVLGEYLLETGDPARRGGPSRRPRPHAGALAFDGGRMAPVGPRAERPL